MNDNQLETAQSAYTEARSRLAALSPALATAFPDVKTVAAVAAEHHRAADSTAVSQVATQRKTSRGHGRIFQRGNQWWIAYYAPKEGRSVEHREPGGPTEREARRKLKERLDEVAVHKTGLRPFQGLRQERIMVEDLLKSLERHYEIHGKRSLRRLRSHLKHIRASFGMDRAIAVTPKRLCDYVAARQDAKVAPATINRELEGLQRAFSLAVEDQVLTWVPKFPSLPEENARQGFFEKGDFQAVLAHITDADVRDYLEWFYWTGMRPGEIRSLTWAAFDQETWTIRLHARDAKTRRGRVIALEGDLHAIVQRRLSARRLECPFIFHRRGGPMGEFRKVWKKACTAAGVSDRIPYDCRRTAVRNMRRAGVSETVAMRISGHKTRSVFDRYDIVDERDLRDAVLKTTAYVATLPTKTNIMPLNLAKKVAGQPS